MTRRLVAVVAVALAGVGVGACGDSSKGRTAATRAPSPGVVARGSAPQIGVGAAAPAGHLEGDEDDDDPPGSSTGSSRYDNDDDFDNDLTGNRGKGYYDEDDGLIEAYGRAASAVEMRTIAALAERYRASALARDGASACAMLDATLRGTIPATYGQNGPAYLRGATTCGAVLSRLFGHSDLRPIDALEVTAVRVDGDRGYALMGSRTTPASYVPVEREGGRWWIAGLLVGQLP